MVELKTPGEIEAMRGGRSASSPTHSPPSATAAAVGVRLDELDEVARGVLRAAGATFAVPRLPAVVRADPVSRACVCLR